MLWRGAESYGSEADIWTGTFANGRQAHFPIPSWCAGGARGVILNKMYNMQQATMAAARVQLGVAVPRRTHQG